MIEVLTKVIVIIMLQYMNVSNQQVLYLNLTRSYFLIIPQLKNKDSNLDRKMG